MNMRLRHAWDVEIPIVSMVFYSSAATFVLVRGEIAMMFLLVCDETLLLVRGKVFYSAARTISSGPRRAFLLVYGEAFYSSVVRPSTHLQ